MTASTVRPSRSQLFVTIMRVDRTTGAPVVLPEPPSTHRIQIEMENILDRDHDALDTMLIQTELLESDSGVALRVSKDLVSGRSSMPAV